MTKKPLYDRIDQKLHKWAGTIGAVIAIVGAVTGAYTWASKYFANAVSAQINEFQEEVREADKELQQSVTRVELLELIEHDPDNTVAIEKLARYYFVDLKGDKWMSERYSAYAKEHGLNEAFVVGGE